MQKKYTSSSIGTTGSTFTVASNNCKALFCETGPAEFIHHTSKSNNEDIKIKQTVLTVLIAFLQIPGNDVDNTS